MRIKLRDWQEEAYQKFEKNNFRGILEVGTGKGKTIFAIYCIQKFIEENENFRTCIVVPTINLMKQWKREIIKFLEIPDSEIGLFYGQKKEESKKITITVINSAVKNNSLEKIHSKNPFDLLITDECHHYGSTTFSKIFKFDTEYSLGLSATPERENDVKGTKKIVMGIGKKIFKLSHLDDPKAIPPFCIWSILVNLTGNELNEYKENSKQIIKLNEYFSIKFGIDYSDEKSEKIKKLAEKNNHAAKKMLSLWSKQANVKYNAENKIELIDNLVDLENENKIIIFSERINFSKKIYKKLKNKSNLNVFIIHSKLSKKEVLETLEKFRKSKIGVLIATKMIDEGYDVPDASVAIISSFTKSARQMIQRDGRILRKTNQEKIAKRYSLIVRDIEERKYFHIIKKSHMSKKVLEGEWIEFNGSVFLDKPEFKQDFIEYEKNKNISKRNFESWVEKKLDYYNNTLEIKDIIERRVDFFSKKYIIEYLSKDETNRWKNLKNKSKNNKNVLYRNNLSTKKKKILKEELRYVNSSITLGDKRFNSIFRFIEGESFELDEYVKRYIRNLTDGKNPGWPENLYDFLKIVMRNKILDENKGEKEYEKSSEGMKVSLLEKNKDLIGNRKNKEKKLEELQNELDSDFRRKNRLLQILNEKEKKEFYEKIEKTSKDIKILKRELNI